MHENYCLYKCADTAALEGAKIIVYRVKQCSCCTEVEGMDEQPVMLVNLLVIRPCARRAGAIWKLPEGELAVTMEIQVFFSLYYLHVCTLSSCGLCACVCSAQSYQTLAALCSTWEREVQLTVGLSLFTTYCITATLLLRHMLVTGGVPNNPRSVCAGISNSKVVWNADINS